ncbi:DUF6804 family protein, partial [Robbsia andropogonis]|uniref:DUF6804 family protein n=1 Tax=Robbsia andropogonis TaxID=28092 RepID=UPI0020A1BB37
HRRVAGMAASTSRYGTKPDPGWRRLALIPGLIAAVALLVGTAVLAEDTFTVFRFVVSIFALIVAVFAYQAKQWWWLPLFAGVAVLWNPIWPIPLEGPWWTGAQYVAALLFLVGGWLIKVPIPEEQRRAH